MEWILYEGILYTLGEFLSLGLGAGVAFIAFESLAAYKEYLIANGLVSEAPAEVQVLERRESYNDAGQLPAAIVPSVTPDGETYKVTNSGILAQTTAESMLGSVANACGITLTPDLPHDKITEALRNAGTSEGGIENFIATNTGTAEAPVYQTATFEKDFYRYFKAMWDAGFFDTGEPTTELPTATGAFTVTSLGPCTIDTMLSQLDKVFAAGFPWWNDTYKQKLRDNSLMQAAFSQGYNFFAVDVITMNQNYCNMKFQFANLPLPLSTFVGYTGSTFATYTLGAALAVTAEYFALQLYANNVNLYWPRQELTSWQPTDRQVIGCDTFSSGAQVQSQRGVTSNLSMVAGQSIAGIIRQIQAAIPTSRDTDFSLASDWAMRWRKASTLTGEGTITDTAVMPTVIDPTSSWDTAVDQADARVGEIADTPDTTKDLTGAITGAITAPYVSVLDPAIPKVIALDPVIPTGDTPPVIIPTDDGSAGLFTVYAPSRLQLNDISAHLWQSNFLSQLQQIFSTAYEAVISLQEIYVNPITSGSEHITFGNLILTDVTTGKVPVVANRYRTIEYNKVKVPQTYGNSYDFAPYTSASIYLPFIGMVGLHVNDIMGGYVKVKYIVDVVSGCCVAQVIVERDKATQLLYTFEGNCSMQLPVTGRDNVLKSELSILTAVAAIGSGAGLGATAAAIGSIDAPDIHHKSSFSSNAGALSPRVPFLVINHKIPSMADGYFEIEGGSVNKRVVLSSCVGYTKCKEVHLDGVAATSSEKSEIESLLKAGVIF